MFSFFHVYFIFHRFVLLIHLSFFVANSEINYSTLKSLRGLFFFLGWAVFFQRLSTWENIQISCLCVLSFFFLLSVFFCILCIFFYILGVLWVILWVVGCRCGCVFWCWYFFAFVCLFRCFFFIAYSSCTNLSKVTHCCLKPLNWVWQLIMLINQILLLELLMK